MLGIEMKAPGSEASTNIGDIERWASVIGGGALVVHAVVRPSWLNLALGVGGAALAWRGATGHCTLYAALGIDRSAPRAAEDRRPVGGPPEFRPGFGPRGQHSLVDQVELASDHSFPASDAPAWNRAALIDEQAGRGR